MIKLTAKTTACKVHPYFFNISLTFSQRGRASSLSWTCVLNLASSSSRYATLASAASLSEGVAFSSLITTLSSSFWRISSVSCSFSSSRGFVLVSLSSTTFLSFSWEARVPLSLSTLACSLFFCFSSFWRAPSSVFFFKIGLKVFFSCFSLCSSLSLSRFDPCSSSRASNLA